MNSFRFLLFCRLLLALVVSTSLASGGAEARSTVPLQATIAITELIESGTFPPCFMIGQISGAGTATHLGKVTLVSQDCINLISSTEFSFFSNPNQFVLTAANGDQVFATYSGRLTIQGAVGVITGGYQIVGGTGSFSQATGAGTVQGVEDMITGKGQVQLTGTISY